MPIKFIYVSLLVCLSATFSLYASDSKTDLPKAQIEKLKGEVFFENKLVKEGDVIDHNGRLETKEKSFVKLTVDHWKTQITIGPSASMNINLNEIKKYTLENGLCRWKSFEESKSKGKIFTKQASMGVRGTDFTLKSTAILGETEVIMFDGEVLFENTNDNSNTAVLKKGQWGGIGGRFGNKVAPVLDLPKVVLDSAEAEFKQLEK